MLPNAAQDGGHQDWGVEWYRKEFTRHAYKHRHESPTERRNKIIELNQYSACIGMWSVNTWPCAKFKLMWHCFGNTPDNLCLTASRPDRHVSFQHLLHAAVQEVALNCHYLPSARSMCSQRPQLLARRSRNLPQDWMSFISSQPPFSITNAGRCIDYGLLIVWPP